MKEQFTFDDVLIKPKFSTVRSRKDVDLSSQLSDNIKLSLPIISSNMDTVTGTDMAYAMAEHGGIGCLHRFCTIEENIDMFYKSMHENTKAIVSIGLGNEEYNRALALFNVGARVFCIDVANGASTAVVEQYENLRVAFGFQATIIVGNFGTLDSVYAFNDNTYRTNILPDYYKVGIGPGSACTTRIKTGVGHGQLSAILEISEHYNVIADGGMRTPGDIAKALGAGASFVMLGGMLAGTDESPGEKLVQHRDTLFSYQNFDPNNFIDKPTIVKKYRGSASAESYEVQGKMGEWRTAEGESFLVPYKGPVINVLKDIEGGLRSALSYTNSRNLDDFVLNCEFINVSNSVAQESVAHGNKK